MAMLDTNHDRAALVILVLGAALIVALSPFATGLIGIPVLYVIFHPLHAWLAKHPRITLHFTPTSGSWLNLVEVFFGIITRQAIRRGTFTHVRELEQAIHDYLKHHHRKPKPFVWTATANTILNKVKRCCERTSVT